MTGRRARAVLLASALGLALGARDAGAFFVDVRPVQRFTMNLALGETSFPSIGYGSQTWNSLAERALARWNEVGVGPARDQAFFSVTRSTVSDSACIRSGVNHVTFTPTICGRSFGDALAITQSWYAADGRVEADVFLNTAYRFNAYPGPLRPGTETRDGIVYDIYRLLLHEFGHVIGLEHPDENGQQVVAIMNRRVSDVDELQADDIAGAHAVAFGGSLVDEFVRGFYVTVLGRTPTSGELADWVGFLRSNPGSAGAIVRGFFHSPEFLTTRRGTVADYVTTLYTTVLLRPPSQSEIDDWVPHVVERLNRLVPGFVNSEEFQALLRTTPPAMIVERLYREVLGRSPSVSDVNGWVAEVQRTGDWYGIALGFLNSEENLATPRSFAEYIHVLYRTFLDRSPSGTEVTEWLTALTAHLSDIENGFTASHEFQQQIASLLF